MTVVRASISPTNEASLATLRPFGFEAVGEQWDDEDGLELLFERPAGPGRSRSQWVADDGAPTGPGGSLAG